MDDVLDVTSLQGVPGVIGSILVGVFADSTVQRGNPGRNGIFYGNNGSQLGVQILACILDIVWSGFWTCIIMVIISSTVGMDVKPHVEEVGLDIEQIGEQAYDDTLNPLLDLGDNGGSAFSANSQAALAVFNTHISACAAAFVWTILAYRRDKHWHLTEIMGGAFAGLGKN